MERLTGKQKITFLITALILLIILTTAIKHFNSATSDGEINYKKDNIKDLINRSYFVSDRKIYWEAEEVISSLLKSYNIDNESYNKNQYNILTEQYKRNINKNEFANAYKKLFFAFMYKDSTAKDAPLIKENLITTNIIDKIYKFSEQRYIVILKNYNEENYYVGLEFDKENHVAKIFYIG